MTNSKLNTVYAVYFDHQRRNNLEFRKKLLQAKARESRRAAKEAKTQVFQYKKGVKAAAEEALSQYWQQRDANLDQKLQQGENLSRNSRSLLRLSVNDITKVLIAVVVGSRHIEAVVCLYEALMISRHPGALMDCYKQKLPKHVLDIMMHLVEPPTESPRSSSGVDLEALDG